jgi:hypothetical protein
MKATKSSSGAERGVAMQRVVRRGIAGTLRVRPGRPTARAILGDHMVHAVTEATA